MARFKLGQRVRVRTHTSEFAGELGTVVRAQGDDVSITLSDSPTAVPFHFLAEELEAVVPTPTERTSNAA